MRILKSGLFYYSQYYIYFIKPSVDSVHSRHRVGIVALASIYLSTLLTERRMMMGQHWAFVTWASPAVTQDRQLVDSPWSWKVTPSRQWWGEIKKEMKKRKLIWRRVSSFAAKFIWGMINVVGLNKYSIIRKVYFDLIYKKLIKMSVTWATFRTWMKQTWL